MQTRHLFTLAGETGSGESRAVVTLDLDAMMNLDDVGANHPMYARDHLYNANLQREFVRSGWQEGATQASALSQILAGEIPAVESIRRRWEWGSEGEHLDAERALSGDWDVAYQRSVRRKSSGQVITTIGAQFGGRSSRTASELFWTGAQLVAAADVLEAAGYKVEAHAINVCRYNNYSSNSHVGVLDLITKRPEEPMRPDLLMAAVANERVYRGFGFLAKCYLPVDYRVAGMGSTVDNSAAAAKPFLDECASMGILAQIDNMMPHAYTREQAVTNVLTVLRTVTGRE